MIHCRPAESVPRSRCIEGSATVMIDATVTARLEADHATMVADPGSADA